MQSSTGHHSRREHDFLLFSYLLRFVHREGKVGDDARAGLLSLIDVAMGSASPFSKGMALGGTSGTKTPAREAALAFAEYLLDSDFADVLGAGMGALYGLMPAKLVVRSEDTHSTPNKNKSWDDPVVTDHVGVMVLGGLGALGDDEEAEELERKREEEDARLRSLGVGISSESDFKEALDCWLKLVEFVQEVMRKITTNPPDSLSAFDIDDADAETRQQGHVMRALSASIASSVKTLFLEAVLYPSIMECSDQDGSAVAVLCFLNAMLEVVVEDSPLATALLGFLLGDDEMKSHRRTRRPMLSSPTLSQSSPFLSPASNSKGAVKRRKSSALLIVESVAPKQSKTYDADVGRFGLKDLLLLHLGSDFQPATTAALKLLHTLLTRHDRWSLAVLDVVVDDAATSFPVILRAKNRANGASVENEDDSDESDSGSEKGIKAGDNALLSSKDNPASTPARTRVVLGAVLPSTPTLDDHVDHLETLLSLVATIDPSYSRTQNGSAQAELLSSGFANYVHDAEVAIVSNPGFKRGLGNDAHKSRENTVTGQRPSLFTKVSTISSSVTASTATGIRHRLQPRAKIVSLLLRAMSHFFLHSPDLNLALTAALSSLAAYPYRSLDAWCLPRLSDRHNEEAPNVSTNDASQGDHLSDDGDDRSIDYDVDERLRQDHLFSPTEKRSTASPTGAALAGSDSLLSILAALAHSIAQYRSKIPSFDRYLSERRQGLFFVENLADALDLEGENVFGPSTPQRAPAVEENRPLPLPLPSRQSKSGFVALLTPRPTHSRAASTNLAFSTPPSKATRARRRSSSVDGDVSSNGRSDVAPDRRDSPASPFAAHYRQTGSIKVQPVVVSTPLQASMILYDDSDDDEDDHDDETAASSSMTSPTRRLSPAPPSTSKGPSETGSDAFDRIIKSHSKVISPVTLSSTLDNVLILQEFVKELAAVVQVRRSLGIDGIRYM